MGKKATTFVSFTMPMIMLAIRFEVENIFKSTYQIFFSKEIHEKIAMKYINDVITYLIDPNIYYSRLSFFESGRQAIDIKYNVSVDLFYFWALRQACEINLSYYGFKNAKIMSKLSPILSRSPLRFLGVSLSPAQLANLLQLLNLVFFSIRNPKEKVPATTNFLRGVHWCSSLFRIRARAL